MSLLGMDVVAARSLASSLDRWSTVVDDGVQLIIVAEVLSDLPCGADELLVDIGSDGARMADAIRQAARVLEGFTVQLHAPHDIAAAVANVHAFSGGDNHPESERRLNELRRLVEPYVGPGLAVDDVVTLLLGQPRYVTVSDGEVAQVEAAIEVVRELKAAESAGLVDASQVPLGAAVHELRSLLAEYARSDEELNQLMRRFVSGSADVSVQVALTAVLNHLDESVVELAHEATVGYEVAASALNVVEINSFTEQLANAAGLDAAGLAAARAELFDELIDDRHAVETVGLLDPGALAAFDAFAEARAARDFDELVREIGIERLEVTRGLTGGQAEEKLDELYASAEELIDAGWEIDDAGIAVDMADLAGLDIREIETFAAFEDDLDLVDATIWLAEAKSLAMTPDEYRAFLGLDQYFGLFDAIREGTADGIVSIEDLEHVAARPDTIGAEAAAAAAAILAQPGLRNRLDSAAAHGDVVDHDSFGANRPADGKISNLDLRLFRDKQLVNFMLQDRVDMIDVADQEDMALADTMLSEEDFQFVLDNHVELGLSDIEVQAVEIVLQADWYDKTGWQEHGDWFILAAAVVVGAAVFAGTAGAGGGVGAALIVKAAAATASGAAVGGGLTLGENLLTGDPWAEDLLENITTGAIGGLGGSGLAGGFGALGIGPAAGKVSAATGGTARIGAALGLSADAAGLVSTGLIDPLADFVGVDPIDLDQFKDDAQIAGYLLGGLNVAGGLAAAPVGDIDKTLKNVADQVVGAGQRGVARELDVVDAALDAPNESDGDDPMIDVIPEGRVMVPGAYLADD